MPTMTSKWFACAIAACVMSVSTYANADELTVPTQYPTVQAAVDAAIDGDTILVEPGVYSGAGNSQIDFAGKRLNVMATTGDPYMHTFLSNTGGPAFDLQPSAASESNIIGFSFVGTGDLVRIQGATVQVSDCRFDSVGRAVGIQANGATATVWECEFYGLEIGIESRNGALSVTGCRFEYSAQQAVYHVGDALAISNSEFVRNEGCVFAFAAEDVSISYCSFIENSKSNPTSTLGFGVVNVSAPNQHVQVSHSLFRENEVGLGEFPDGGSMVPGGALRLSGPGTADIFHCEFQSNTAVGGGAAITVWEQTALESDVVVRESQFSENIALAGFGAPSGFGFSGACQGIRVVEDCEFISNRATASGGGAIGSPDITALRTIFRGNSAMGSGGAILAGLVRIEDCDFRGNYAEDDGGAIAATGLSSERTDYVGNAAGGDGGVIDADRVEISHAFLHENRTLSGAGGAVFGGFVDARWCCFCSNSAEGPGGAIRANTPWPGLFGANLYNCRLSSNSSSEGAGAVMNANIILNCDITWNGAAPRSAPIVGAAEVHNSILWNLTEHQILELPGLATNASYSVIRNGFPGTAIIDADPLVGDPFSPVVDAGDGSRLPAFLTEDINGDPRCVDSIEYTDSGIPCINGSVVDIGAVEAPFDQPFEPVVEICEGDADGDGEVDADDISTVLFNLGCVSCDEMDALLLDDGVVDVNDITFVLFRLGATCK